MSERLPIKLLLVGETGVGKTNILRRFCGQDFASEHVPTQQSSSFENVLTDIQGHSVKYEIHDSSALLQYRPRLFWEIRVASGIVVVYDVTDTESFERVATGFRSWANEIRGAEYESSPKILVANKTDLVEQRIITPEQGQALARKMGWLYAETSAKTKTGVEQAFCDLSIPALQRKLDRVAALAHDDA